MSVRVHIARWCPFRVLHFGLSVSGSSNFNASGFREVERGKLNCDQKQVYMDRYKHRHSYRHRYRYRYRYRCRYI